MRKVALCILALVFLGQTLIATASATVANSHQSKQLIKITAAGDVTYFNQIDPTENEELDEDDCHSSFFYIKGHSFANIHKAIGYQSYISKSSILGLSWVYKPRLSNICTFII